MRKFLALAVVCMLFMQMQCEDEEKEDIIVCPPSDECSIPATVRDRTQSGCYYLLELNDGTLISPYIIGYCGTPPVVDIPKEPLYTVDLKEGLKVVIGYEPAPADAVTPSCADKTWRITCIRVVDQEDPDTR